MAFPQHNSLKNCLKGGFDYDKKLIIVIIIVVMTVANISTG